MKKNSLYEIIKTKRLSLDESQAKFGARFNVSSSAVSLWESNQREAPYKVIEFCLNLMVCPRCEGRGTIRKGDEK